jgi:cellulose synthase/poly-beta-1,6-N-acetylglucosamine synthase-like glycosyltransferase
VLERASGDVVYLLDADAAPDPGVLTSARAAPAGRHLIQGRNIIRNTSHLLGKVVAVEFAAKYMVSHFTRSRVTDRQTARAVGFSNASLVEDVEASVRADRAGLGIVIDPTMAATELAPVRLRDWWRQRRRWAQGWLDVGDLHAKAILLDARFSLWKKMNWFYVIYCRRVAYGLTTFWLLLLALYLWAGGSTWGLRALSGFVCLQLCAGAAQSAAVAVQCYRLGEPPPHAVVARQICAPVSGVRPAKKRRHGSRDG